jgi:hypothetical protein
MRDNQQRLPISMHSTGRPRPPAATNILFKQKKGKMKNYIEGFLCLMIQRLHILLPLSEF